VTLRIAPARRSDGVCQNAGMISVIRDRPIRLVAAGIATLALLAIGPACSSGEGADASAGSATTTFVAVTPTELLGAWEGTYQFPTPDGGLFPSPLRLVVEKQEQGALWGYEEFEDSGELIRIPITGSLDDEGPGFGFAATGLILDGTMTGPDQMDVRFFKVSDPATSFDVTLRRVAS
jgi:hypothetical protein